jgi:hypothetical protein
MPNLGPSVVSAAYWTELACKIKVGNSLLSQILTALTPVIKTVDAELCDNTLESANVTSTVQTVPHPDFVQKVQLCPSPQKDPEVVCISNDSGQTIVSGWEVFDISQTGVVTSTIYLNGVDVTGTYIVVPCGIKVKYDYEREETCVDGKDWEKVYVFDPSSAIPTLVGVLWLDENDLPQPAPDPLLINNINCIPVCTPVISEAYGNNISTLQASNNFSIQKPDCCVVRVTTDAGTFTVQKGVGYYSTSDFQCLVTVTAVEIVSGNCTLDSVYIIGNKLK